MVKTALNCIFSIPHGLRRGLLIILMLVQAIGLVQGQSYVVSKRLYSTKDGLSHNHVHQVFKDSRGILWLVTGNGIGRFDGKNFKFISHPKLRWASEAEILLEDNDHDLWIKRRDATIFFLNIHTEEICEMEKKFGKATPTRMHWVVKGLSNSFLAQTTINEVVRLQAGKAPEKIISQPDKLVAPLVELADGTIWFESNYRGRGGELFAMNRNGETIRSIQYRGDHIYEKGVWGHDTIFYLSRDSLFLATVQGIVLGKRLTDLYPEYQFTDPYETGQFPIVKVVPDKSQVWFSFPYSVVTFTKSFEKIWNLPDTRKEMLSGNIYDLLPDKQGNVWMCSMDGLLNVRIRSNLFQPYFATEVNGGLSHELRSCRAIQQAADGCLYFIMAPYLCKISRDGKTEIVITFQENESPTLRALHADAEGNLWFTGKNVYSYNVFSKKTTTIPIYPSTQLEAWALLRDGNQLWIGNPLLSVDLTTRNVEYYTKINGFDELTTHVTTVYQIEDDKKNGIWFVTNTGLYLMDREKGIVARYWRKGQGIFHLPNDDLRHMFVDAEGVYWLASTEGVLRWSPKTGEYRLLAEAEGIPKNCHAVLADAYGFLWISSDFGLIQFDINTSRAKRYLTMDGLTNDEFNRLSYEVSSTGKFYFGGLNGVVGFDPKNFTQNFLGKVAEANLVLTECFLFSGKTKREEDIRKKIKDLGKIEIHPGDGFLRLRFALTDYTDNSKINYGYTIEGYENDWHVGNDNELLLSGLPYGKYTLIISAGSEGIWSDENILRIPIEVWPPFYLRKWFLIAMAIFLIGSVYWGIRARLLMLNRRAQWLEKAVKERTVIIDEQRQRLKQLYDFKTRMYSNVTHEFKTPLTLILGPVSKVMQSEIVKSSPALSLALEQIKNNGEQLLRLINELLDLNKLESNVLAVNEVSGDIVFFVKNIIGGFYALAKNNAISLVFESETEHFVMDFDPAKTEKIINNLLSNAIKFTPPDGLVTITLKVSECWLYIEVLDTGKGILPENIPFIFDRFYQEDASASRRTEGTGIGLAMVKELTALLQGEIRVVSQPGQGSRFTVQLPVRHAAKKQLDIVPAEEPTLGISDGLSFEKNDGAEPSGLSDKLYVLVIEDNVALADYIVYCLRDTYRVEAVSNGIKGVETALERIPDLVVCDIMMPEMDGYEVCAALKSNERTSHIPVMFLTALSEPTERLMRIRIGVDAFLSKPFVEEELLAQIGQLFESRKLLQERYLSMMQQDASSFPQDNTQESILDHELQFLQRAKELVVLHLDDVSLEGKQLARLLGMSHPQLHRKLTALTGLSVGRYIHRVRLQEAQRLLSERRDLSISEIAYQTGFSDPAYFTRLFTKAFGVSPSVFRSMQNTM